MNEEFEMFFDEQENEKKEEFENLPIELQGKDLLPDEMEKLKNDFPTLRDYITISFNREQTKELAQLLGVPTLDATKKNTYTFDEIKASNDFGLLN